MRAITGVNIWVVVKIMVPFWVSILIRHLIILGCPKMDHDFDNHPYMLYRNCKYTYTDVAWPLLT